MCKTQKMNSTLYIHVSVNKINFLNQIIEGYEYLGLLTTINKWEGIVAIYCTSDTRKEAEKILNTLPFYVEIINHKE